jgi:hypothetical protein
MATYDDVRNNLDTGDIVLFSGKGLISMGLKIGALCTWSHVAMVVRVREPDVALLYQSTPVCKAKDFMDGILKNGVQINVMSEAVKGGGVRAAGQQLPAVVVGDTRQRGFNGAHHLDPSVQGVPGSQDVTTAFTYRVDVVGRVSSIFA